MNKKISVANRIAPEPAKLNPKDVTKDQAVVLIRNMMHGAGIDVDEKIIRRQKKNDLLGMFNNMASLISRSSMASALGQSFNGRRDLYETVGWKKELVFTDYLNMYERNGIAARLVDLTADETWRKFPVLHDGNDADDYQDSTPFLKEWLDVVETHDLQSKFHELDIALGISRYAIMVIGVQGEDGMDYQKPLGAEKEGRAISWIRVLDEGQVTMTNPVNEPFSPRYGLPDMYGCQFEKDGVSVPVHHSRVVHFTRGRGRSNQYGVPGLQKVFNYLQDLEKVVGSSSEAFWQHIRRTIALIAREGFNLPEQGTPAYTKLENEIEEFEHQMRLVLKLRNMDVQDLSSSAVDGRGQGDLLFSVIAGTWGTPQRILVGSERGELASSQDVLNMNNSIKARQQKESTLHVKKLVKYLYTSKFITPPKSGKFTVEWLPLYDPSPMEKMDIAKAEVEVLDKITDGNIAEAMNVDDFMDRHFDGYRKPKPDKPGKTTSGVLPGGGGEDEPENDEDAGLADANPNSQRMG